MRHDGDDIGARHSFPPSTGTVAAAGAILSANVATVPGMDVRELWPYRPGKRNRKTVRDGIGYGGGGSTTAHHRHHEWKISGLCG